MARTNIDLDDVLVKEGLKVTCMRTKRELVKKARIKRMLKL